MKNERVLAQLQRPLPSFEAQNPAGAKRYETLTAAINIAPATDKHHNITQIKEDTEWLSKDLSINQIQALRTVLLEWQNRPHLHLQAGYAEPEIASLRDIYGAQSAFDAEFEATILRLRDEDEFKTNTDRRRRQLVIHVQESIGFARVWLACRDQSIAKSVAFGETFAFDIVMCMNLLCDQINLYAKGLEWDVIDEDSNYIWQTGVVHYVQYLMQALVYLIRQVDTIPAECVERWMQMMSDSQFLQTIEPSPLLPSDQFNQLRSLVSVTTFALMDTAQSVEILDKDPLQHWASKKDLNELVTTLFIQAVDGGCVQAVPAVFSWALLLRKICSRASEEQTTTADNNRYQEIYDVAAAAANQSSPNDFFFRETVKSYGVADILLALATTYAGDLLPIVQKAKLKCIQEIVYATVNELSDNNVYGPTVLLPQFGVLDPPRSMLTSGFEYVRACDTFLAADVLRQGLLDVAAARFPYEPLPFLRLCRQLALAFTFQESTQYITYLLDKLTNFTQVAMGSFENYHTIREDENLNLVALDQNAYAFPKSYYAAITQTSEQQESLIVPAGTEGVVITNPDETPVISWKMDYSGLTLIGEWLDLYSKGELDQVLGPNDADQDVIAESILLLANLVVSTFHSGNEGRDDAVQYIYDEVSKPLQFGVTVIALVFDIIEQELQSYTSRPSNLWETGVLVSSLAFARAVLMTRPALFWQHIAKSSIVNARGSSGLLWTVIAGVESTAESAPLAELSTQLYDDMILAALRRGVNAPAEKQWRSTTQNTLLNARENLYESIMTSMTQNMVLLFESLSQWKEKQSPQKPKITTNLCRSFSSVLRYRYGVGKPTSQLSSCFEGSANLIFSRLRPESVTDASVGAILSHLFDAVDLTPSFSTNTALNYCQEALLQLADVLTSTAISLKEPAVGLELCLFDLLPVLIRKIHRSQFRPQSVLRLLQSLLQTIPAKKTASLLGHLGAASSIDLVDILTSTQSSLNLKTASDSWKLLALLISKDQQWLSAVLLTGSIPGKSGKEVPSQQYVYRGRLVMDIATDTLLNIERAGKRLPVVKEVLSFLITEQQTWSWTSTSVESKHKILRALTRFISTAVSPSTDERNIIALITDLTSGYLHYIKSKQDSTLIKTCSPLIDWLTRNVIEVNSYNQSLQTNFASNFSEKFRVNLDDFRINHSIFRDANDLFDKELADIVLSGTGVWMPAKAPSWKTSTYRSEMARVNDNLALVSADLSLLHGFQKLCIEHSILLARDEEAKKTLLDIILRCLMANADSPPTEQIFENLQQTRADMALTLTQSLTKNTPDFTEKGKALLKVAWEAALFCNSNYEQAILNNDLRYWRSCLLLVILTLQAHTGSGWKPLPKNPSSKELLKYTSGGVAEAVQVATVIVGQGLGTVVSVLQEQKQAEMQQQQQTEVVDVGIKDIALILNVLETLLRHERLPEFVGQLSERLVATDAIQSSLRLYSWAHLLASSDTDNDPVHAELGIRLLVSLSSLPTVAEEMAVEGTLNTILTARVTQVLQKVPEGISSLDKRPHCPILYTIWSEGILPLCLNLLHAVGAPLASEISLFLNSFPEQLKRAGTAFQPREGPFITLGSAKEASTLALISYVLDDYRNAGASAAVDPNSIYPLAGFDEHKKAMTADLKEHIDLDAAALKVKLVPTTEKELSWQTKDELAKKVLSELKMAHACLASFEDLNSSTTETNRPAGNRAFND